MTDPALEAMFEMFEGIRQRGLKRSHTQHRIQVDPLAHMVGYLLSRLAEVPVEERQEAVLDATGAIMDLLDVANAPRPQPRPRMTADDYLRQGRLDP